MSRHTELVDALEGEAWEKVSELGWGPVLGALKRNWPKRLSGPQAAAYAEAVGHVDPADVVAALLDHVRAGKAQWRPGPAQLAAIVAAYRGTTSGPRAARPRPDQTRAALDEVRRIIGAGAGICGCVGARTFSRSDVGVLRCVTCGGLECGQVEDAACEREAA